MNKDTTPAHPWEMMQTAREAIGMNKLQKILSVGHAQISRYCRNPAFTEKSARGPIENLRLILDAMLEAGAEAEAEAIVDYLAHSLGLELRHKRRCKPDKATIEEECLDDYPDLTLAHELMRQGDNPASVRAMMRKHIAECEETLQKYEQEKHHDAE